MCFICLWPACLSLFWIGNELLYIPLTLDLHRGNMLCGLLHKHGYAAENMMRSSFESSKLTVIVVAVWAFQHLYGIGRDELKSW